MSENIKLFVALPVSADLRGQAERLPRKGLDSPRWLHLDDLHITLRFMGDVPKPRVADIEDKLAQIRVAPFTIVAKGLDIFRKKHQSILYIPIETQKKVTHLSAEITDRLIRAGFDFPMDREYTPHITLARLDQFHGLPEYIERHRKTIDADWKAQSFALYRSADPDDKGKRYTKLSDYKLI